MLDPRAFELSDFSRASASSSSRKSPREPRYVLTIDEVCPRRPSRTRLRLGQVLLNIIGNAVKFPRPVGGRSGDLPERRDRRPRRSFIAP